MVEASEESESDSTPPKPPTMRGWKRALAVAFTTILGGAVGAWSQYPEENGFDLTVMAVVFGALVGLVLSTFFGPRINFKSFLVAWTLTLIAGIIAGQPLYENRFYRGEAVAWGCSLAFGLVCMASRTRIGRNVP